MQLLLSEAPLTSGRYTRNEEPAEEDRKRLREELRTQFALILQTRETSRGLIFNMSDVLFDSGKATLKPGAREKLAKISGIVLATAA